MNSKKHAKNVNEKKEQPEVKKPVKNEEGKQKTTLDSSSICLFCNILSQNLEENIKHMKVEHTFELPYSSILKDPSATLRYLAEKIHIGNICIGCNNVHTCGFKNGTAVQQHMKDKGHSYLDLTIFQEEYANFVTHKSSFLHKIQPMSARISAVMTLKEIEEMKKAEEEEKGDLVKDDSVVSNPLSASGTSSGFVKVSAEESKDVISMHSSSSISEVEKPKPAGPKPEKEEDWEDLELHDVEMKAEKTLELPKDSGESISEVSSVSGTVCDEHIMLNTGELVLSNGKL